MKFTYSKEEKLKSHNQISQLFSIGESVSKYPLRMLYIPISNSDDIQIKCGVSVSKRNHKTAVARNYIKRLLRECFRQNKAILIENQTQAYAIMLFYLSKEKPNFQELNLLSKELFKKFNVKTTIKKV